MTAEKENSKKWTRVDDSVKEAFGEYHSKGIEIAFNTGRTVFLPPIEGFSPTIKSLDLEESIARILADPTEEEQKRWAGITEEEIQQNVENYVRKCAEERGVELRESSEG